ncbi:dentin sialophosphoprotein isoform X2 [Bradysia coprophila]|uniref:dentin sialophosphoprotein isoform X2 n=1 Tax=Bradysia coprophila TaxID=38358 RepID=UPI00187DC677|nr:dentin sialophosphoprotein isoform X2 [Bradysia coprophila]
MPTEHKKTKLKANVDIKVEGGQDLHPLGHYIDDRVELIRQIFMSLKSKTIKSIAPDFLQGKSLETIQEYCLDELLGISKKRLQSIINSTQCPDNTDSSDSDVENIEEHISLEEISSDSADEALRANKSKGKAKADNKNGTTEASGSGKKEISVLELLELQARARAIRSQLALEPVTKIELDSENDSDGSSSAKAGKNSTATTSDNSKDQTNSASKNTVQDTNGMQIIKPTVPAVKPVRLKRNFRQRQNEDYDPDEDDDETKSVDNTEPKEKDKKSDDEKIDEKDEKIVESEESVEKKRDAPERSPSPDLIPIIQEPETYCISSDSDEPGSSSVPKYITYPTVVREKLPETEDELFLKKIKEGSSVDLRDLIKARRVDKHTESGVGNSETQIDTSNDTVESSTQVISSSNKTNEKSPLNTNETQQVDKDAEPEEPEEGELTDGDDQDEMEANQIMILSSDDETEVNSKKSDRRTVSREEATSEKVDDETSSESSDSSSGNDSDTDSSDAPIFKEADDDDDIIDLGKDEDLDFEVESSETKTKKSKKTKKKLKNAVKLAEAVPGTVEEEEIKSVEEAVAAEVSNEVVSEIAEVSESTNDNAASKEEEPSTAEDAAENDTWQTRWLRGRNVTKVMATSRLANKVRTKIKQKKSKPEPETVNQDSNDVPATETVTVGPPVEEGSVQHYEVLAAQETDNKNE